jgi:hypothetical protein
VKGLRNIKTAGAAAEIGTGFLPNMLDEILFGVNSSVLTYGIHLKMQQILQKNSTRIEEEFFNIKQEMKQLYHKF